MAPPIVDKESHLLGYLIARFPGYKKTKLKEFLKYGSITVNSVAKTAYDHPLRPGDRVDIRDRRSALCDKLKSWLPFQIVYEDTDLIVVDKPAGLLTMGTDTDKTRTVYFELTAYVRSQSKDGRGRVFIVHRLDRESSGLVVFAKREAVKRKLQEHWADTVKKYYAVAEGTPTKRAGVLESYLVEDKSRRVYSTNERSRGAKHAATRYEVLRSNQRYSLLDITLLTGRKNQIRVHFSDLGHPIAGDEKYGGRPDTVDRLALHAYFLSFRHPETGELKTFKSEFPESLAKLV